MTSDQVLIVAMSFVTGGFAVAGTWFGSRLGRKNEYQQWLRNQKRAAYSEFIGAFDALYLETGLSEVDGTAVREVLFDLVVKQGGVSVFGPSEVTKLSDRLVDETWAMAQAARGVGPDAGKLYPLREKAKATAKELVEAIRNDLGVVAKP